MGVNGFGSLTPQSNGQPGSDTLYNNGVSPYPGGSPYSLTQPTWKRSGKRRFPGEDLLGGKGFHLPSYLS